MKNIISEGKLGNIKEVEIRFDRFRTTASGKVHKENPDLPASGALHDLGAHLADHTAFRNTGEAICRCFLNERCRVCKRLF